jgi:hypothetical protein
MLKNCISFVDFNNVNIPYLILHALLHVVYLSISISISVYGSTALVDLGRFFSFLIYTQSLGLLGRGISPSQGLYLYTEQHKQNKRTQTSMPRVGLEATIPVFERAKTVHSLDRAATVISRNWA